MPSAILKAGMRGAHLDTVLTRKGRDIALRCPPPAFQRAERAAEAGRSGSFVPSPDAALGDGDGAARHPYQRHGNSVEMRYLLHQRTGLESRLKPGLRTLR